MRLFQFSHSLLIVKISSLAIALFLHSSQAFANPARQAANVEAFMSCEWNKSSGTLYYDFDALIVKFADYPMTVGSVPPALEYPRVREILIASLKKNFARCLTKSFGRKKSIILFSPYNYNKEGRILEVQEDASFKPTSEYGWKDIHDPKNLTIVIQMVREQQMADAFFMISYFIYRPEVSELRMRTPTDRVTSGMTVIFPENGDEQVNATLNRLFSEIGPLELRPPGNIKF